MRYKSFLGNKTSTDSSRMAEITQGHNGPYLRVSVIPEPDKNRVKEIRHLFTWNQLFFEQFDLVTNYEHLLKASGYSTCKVQFVLCTSRKMGILLQNQAAMLFYSFLLQNHEINDISLQIYMPIQW